MEVILITGSAGFIGMHLCQKLLENGFTVVGIDNINDYYDVTLKQRRLAKLRAYENFVFYKSDIADKAELFSIMEKHRPYKIINLAAQAGVRYSLECPEAYIHSNIDGFLTILEACRHFDVDHLLYASSSSVYGGNTKLPFSVDDRVDSPVSLYAATKRSNELMAHCYSHLFGVRATGLRFFTVYGPWGRPDMALYLFVKAILAGEAISVFNNGEMWRDFTYVDDIVNGITELMDKSRAYTSNPSSYIYNIGNNKPVKLTEFIACIENALNRTAKKKLLPMQPGDVPSTYADIEDLMADTNFRPSTPIAYGVGKFVDWYLQEIEGVSRGDL